MSDQVYVVMEFRYREDSMSLDRDDVLAFHGRVFADPADAQAEADRENHDEARRRYDRQQAKFETAQRWNVEAEKANDLMRAAKVGVPPHALRPLPEPKSYEQILATMEVNEGWLYVEPWDLVPSSNPSEPQILVDDGLGGSIEVTDELRQNFSKAGAVLLAGDAVSAARVLFADLPADHPLMQPVELPEAH